MKRFLLQSAIFISAFFALFIVCIYAVTAKEQKAFRLDNGQNKIFLGNSHLECALNDTIVPSSFNFARSGERMEWVYAKLRLLADNNPGIDTVFIGFDNVLCFKNAKNNDFSMSFFSPYFVRKMSPGDFMSLAIGSSDKYNFELVTKMLHASKLYEMWRERNHGPQDMSMGGYVASNRNKLKEDIERRGTHDSTDKTRHRVKLNPTAKYFLDKSIEFCRDNNITPIFIFAPQHPLSSLDNDSYMAEYKKYYSDIPFWDFRELPIGDSGFQDLDHLNYPGSLKFSSAVSKKIHEKHRQL